MASTDRPIASAFPKAQRHLARRDPILKGLIRAVGPCTLQHNPDAFVVLVRAIISQMISTKAAASIFARLQSTLDTETLTPAGILAKGEAAIRAVGLSGAKTRALMELAQTAETGELSGAHLATLTDDEVINLLVKLRGIGRWTAEMFLIFSLGRLDVLPVHDLGLRAGVRDHYRLDELPNPAALLAHGEPWRPYRSLATWYIWRYRDVVPAGTQRQ